MSFRIPSFSEMLSVAQSRGANSDAPELWDGLVGLWPLAAGGGIKGFDLSGYGNHGDWNGTGVHWAASERGVVGQFNGIDDYAAHQEVVTSGNAFTVSLWCRFPDSGQNNPFAYTESVESNDTANLFGIYCGDKEAGKTFRVFMDNNDLLVYGDRADWADQWVHVVVVQHTSTNREILINSISRNTTTVSLSVSPLSGAIGAFRAASVVQYYVGLLSNIRTYNRALTASAIQHLYADPFASLRLRRKVYASAVSITPSVDGTARLIFLTGEAA